MKKSTSLILGILAILVWIAMVVVLVFSYHWLTTTIQRYESSPTGYVGILFFYLVAWVFWGISVIYAVLYAIGLPHYFLYLLDRHKVAYIYLVKYLSAIPLAIIGFIFLVLITNYISDASSIPLEWFSIVLCAVPLSALLLFVHVPNQKFNRNR